MHAHKSKSSSIAQSNACQQFPFSIVYGKFIENSRRRTRNPLEMPSRTYINAKILYNIERDRERESGRNNQSSSQSAAWGLRPLCLVGWVPVIASSWSTEIGRQATRQCRQPAMWQLNWNKIELKAFCGKKPLEKQLSRPHKQARQVKGGRGSMGSWAADCLIDWMQARIMHQSIYWVAAQVAARRADASTNGPTEELTKR